MLKQGLRQPVVFKTIYTITIHWDNLRAMSELLEHNLGWYANVLMNITSTWWAENIIYYLLQFDFILSENCMIFRIRSCEIVVWKYTFRKWKLCLLCVVIGVALSGFFVKLYFFALHVKIMRKVGTYAYVCSSKILMRQCTAHTPFHTMPK